jgi:hypothetical protein
MAQGTLIHDQACSLQSSVTLIRNLGGGWQWDDSKERARR